MAMTAERALQLKGKLTLADIIEMGKDEFKKLMVIYLNSMTEKEKEEYFNNLAEYYWDLYKKEYYAKTEKVPDIHLVKNSP